MQTAKMSIIGEMNAKFGVGAECPREGGPGEAKVFRISRRLPCLLLLRREMNLITCRSFSLLFMSFSF